MILERVRDWARGHTREKRYSPVGITFHWSMAALVIFQLWWGWRAGRLPVGHSKLEAYEVHSQVGLLILVLALARMIWRLLIPGPQNDADKPGWQSKAAHLTHFAFYACFIGLPLSGWAMMSATAREQDLSVAGVAPWPQLPFSGLPPERLYAIEAWAEQVHFALILTILILIPLHVGAALKHEIIDQDDVFEGMVPGAPRAERAVARGWRRIWKPRRSRDPKAAG